MGGQLTYLTGIVKDGPLKGTIWTHDRVRYDPPAGGGFYVHVPRRGPAAAYWHWIPSRDLEAPDPLGR